MRWMEVKEMPPISIPLMNLSAAACQACPIYVVSQPFVKLPTVVVLACVFLSKMLLWIWATPAHSGQSPSVICFYLVQISFFFSLFPPIFFPLWSCIVVSSSWAIGASRISHKHNRQGHFSQVDFQAIQQDVFRQMADMWQTHVTHVSLH